MKFVTNHEAAYPPPTIPDPVEHCDICRWNPVCRDTRRKTDDLSLVASISTLQRRLLRERGITTRTALSKLDLSRELTPPLKPRAIRSLENICKQAGIQVEGDHSDTVLYEFLELDHQPDELLDTKRGLFTLPEPSPGDLFFDIEGDPFALEDGVDYLFGVLEPSQTDPSGNPMFHSFWQSTHLTK